MFYNTGIATYIWVLSNRKPDHRQDQVQLIDASEWYRPLRKNLGQKNCELAEADIQRIVETFLAFEESEQSKLFPNQAFGYWKIVVERPLRLRVDLGEDARARLRTACQENDDDELTDLVDALAAEWGPGPHLDLNAFLRTVETTAEFRFYKRRAGLLEDTLTEVDPDAAPVIAQVYKRAQPDPLHGRYQVEIDGEIRVVEYESDADLRDTEQIPLLEAGGIEGFFRREVLPYVRDAWIDPDKTKIGYEISFNRYFYEPEPLRPLDEIRADIEALEQETDGLLEQILVDVEV